MTARTVATRRHLGWRGIALAVLSALSASAHSLPASQPFVIPAGSLEQALEAFAAQTHLQVLYAPSLTRGLRSPGVQASATPQEALAQLLGTHAISFEWVDARTLVLRLTTPAAVVTPSVQEAPETAEIATLLSVIVTSQKRSESLQDVPMSVVSLSAERLQARGHHRLSEQTALIPGMTFLSAAPGDAQLALRGISTGPGFRASVGIALDDVPYGSSNQDIILPDMDSMELERIEVLRGPQGTLHGANTLGGLVRYISRRPEPGRDFGQLQLGTSQVEGGNTGFVARAAHNLALGERAALRVGLSRRKDPGFIDNIQGGRNVDSGHAQGARIGWRWQPDADSEVRIDGFQQDLRTSGGNQVDLHQADFGTIAYRHDRLANSDRYRVANRHLATHAHTRWHGLNLSVSLAHSHATWEAEQDVGYTSFGEQQPSLIGMDGLGTALDVRRAVTRFTREFRVERVQPESWRWLLGLHDSNEHAALSQRFHARDAVGADAGFAALLRVENASRQRERAVFFNGGFSLTPQWELQLGLRNTRHSLRSDSANDGLLYPDGIYGSVDNREDVRTHSLSATYKLNSHWTAYLRTASGYRPGGTNSPYIPSAPARYTSDRLISHEAGIRGNHGTSLELEATTFRIRWKDIQLRMLDPVSSSSYHANGGTAISEGVELRVGWTPSLDWRADLSGAYTDARLPQDIPGGAMFGRKGEALPYSSRSSAQLDITRYFTLGGHQVATTFGTHYTGGWSAEFPASPLKQRVSSGGHTTFQLSLGLQGERWRLDAYLQNIGNRHAWRLLRERGSAYVGIPVQPRTLGLNWTLDY